MDNPRALRSTAEVIDALGGFDAVAELTGSKYSAVHNWKAFGAFPAKTFVIMTSELESRGLEAPASLWGMLEPERVAS